MLNVAQGYAEDLDTLAGTKAAIAQAREGLDGKFPDAGIVLAGIEFDHKAMLAEILTEFPGIRIVGCTTCGDFSSTMGLSEYAINLMLFQSDKIEFNVGIGRGVAEDPDSAARQAVLEARTGLTFDEQICLVFPDGLCPSNMQMIKALNRELVPACSVFGGASGRHTSEASQPVQFYQDEVLQDSIPLLMIAGDIDYAFDISKSWTPVGKSTTITEVEGREVKTIGDMPALDFYRYYLGSHSKPASEFPLAVFDDESDDYYIRVPVNYNEEASSVTFGAPIPEGAKVQLSETTSAFIVDCVHSSAETVIDGHKDPAAVLVFSCNARKAILGTQATQELESLKSRLGESVPLLGFYGFAEFGPLHKEDDCHLHHATMVSLLIGHRQPGQQSTAPARTLAEHSYAHDDEEISDLKKEISILRKKLERSEYHRVVLEQNRDSDAVLFKKINSEIEEAREQLAREKENAEHLLLNILPRDIAEELKRTGYVQPVHYPHASVLFTDFQDFGKVANNLEPKKLVEELDFYFSAFDRVIERYKLEKLKTIGDAYMCAGGIPRESEDHVLNIVRAAWDINQFMASLKQKKEARGEKFWALRCGVHAGPIMAGVIGTKKFAYDIWGDTVNIASRLESSADPGSVNISKHVYERVRDEFDCESRGRFEIKNLGELDMFQVVGRRH